MFFLKAVRKSPSIERNACNTAEILIYCLLKVAK